MEQIKEEELSKIAESMNQKTINIIIKGDIGAEYTMPYVLCDYDRRSGIFCISGKLTHSIFVVNTSYIYDMKATIDRKTITFKLDGTNHDAKVRIKIL